MSPQKKGFGIILAAIIGQQVFGALTFPIAKFGLETIEPYTFAFYRFLISSTVLLSIVLLKGGGKPIARGDILKIAGLGVMIILGNQTTFLLGQSMTAAGHSALLFATTPVWIYILARIHLKEKLTWRRTVGIVIAVGGVIVIMSEGAVGFGPEYLIGDLIVFEAVIAWAYYSILGKSLVQKYGALRVTAYALAAGSLVYSPFGIYRAVVFDYAAVPLEAWWSVAYVAIGTSVFSYVLWYWVLKYMEASRVAVYHNLQPVVASGVAYFFLGEPLGVAFVIGGLIVLGGVIVTET